MESRQVYAELRRILQRGDGRRPAHAIAYGGTVADKAAVSPLSNELPTTSGTPSPVTSLSRSAITPNSGTCVARPDERAGGTVDRADRAAGGGPEDGQRLGDAVAGDVGQDTTA